MTHVQKCRALPPGSSTHCWLALWLILLFTPELPARDAFVMLSGGVSQYDNKYSQYLQARAVAAFFEANYPRKSSWVFFGAGNVEGERPVLGDVYRQVSDEGKMRDLWLPGTLP